MSERETVEEVHRPALALSPPPVASQRDGGVARHAAAAAAARRATGTRRLDAGGALALQRTAGNAAVGRVLAREDAPTADDVLDPFGLTEEELAEIAAAAERAKAATRESLLALLEEGHQSFRFVNRLRELPEWQRRNLEKDPEFWRRVRARGLRRAGLWAIQKIVRYGRTAPDEVNALSAAVHGGEWVRARELIMAYPSLRDVPGLREMISLRGGRLGGSYRFEASEARDLLAVLAEGGRRAESGTRYYREAHYEKGTLKTFTGMRNYQLVRIGNQLRVIVRINLKNDPSQLLQHGNVISDKAVSSWEDGIKRRWNGKFRLRSGAKTLEVWFLPIFVYWDPSPHHDVTVMPGEGRSSEHKWHEEDSADTAAHEFGHMIGNPDEYGLPGKMSEIPKSAGLSQAEKKRSSYEGITGKKGNFGTKGIDMENIMGAHHADPSVRERHGWDVLAVFNAKLRLPGEDEWKLELKE